MQGKQIYCSFVDFRKPFDTVPRVRLMRRLQEIGVPIELIWGLWLYTDRLWDMCAPERGYLI